jgi:hypothetical protein
MKPRGCCFADTDLLSRTVGTAIQFTCPLDGKEFIHGARVAVKAMAAKLARLVYRMMRYGMKYVDQGARFYEAQHRNLQLKQLKWKAAKLGYQLVQSPST